MQTFFSTRELSNYCRIKRKISELEHQFLYIALLLLSCTALTSCTSQKYNSVKVLYPKPKADFENFVRVDSLRPTFRWKPILSKGREEPDSYIFSIWEYLGIRWYKGEENWTILGQKDIREVGPSGTYIPGTYQRMGKKTKTTRNLKVVASSTPFYTKVVEECNHTIDSDLIPDTKYLWSVRPCWHTEDGVTLGDWATYNSSVYINVLLASETRDYRSCAFPFMTPSE